MVHTLAVAAGTLLAAVVLAGQAGAEEQEFAVVVVPGLELSDLARLQTSAAVGLLVPGAGPEVSADSALAGFFCAGETVG